ncbi:MAG: aminopeptidase P family protein [Thermomicrobiales bacterium]|nr:aminopeptidase P family protein [Thermomicrobiales bacterium]
MLPFSASDAPPIAADEILIRQQRARDRAVERELAALLVVGRSFYDRPGDLAYLTNHFPPFPTTVFSARNRGMGHAFFLLPVDGQPTLLTDPRKHRADLVAVANVQAAADLGQAVIDLLREEGLANARVGLVGDDIMPAAFDRQIRTDLPDLTLEPVSDLIAGLRRIKSPAELALLRRAALCADAGLFAAAGVIARSGTTEREVGAAGTAAALLAGADFVRYFRVHSGPWSAVGSRWPQAMDRVIEPGEVVVLDAVGACNGYAFDVNRTIVKGAPDAETRAALDLVDQATVAATAACVAGARTGDIVMAARAVLAGTPWETNLGGMMGHGIGLETVEEPYITADENAPLEAAMTLCVEPGISVPGQFGATIEQEIIINPVGPPEIISPTPTRFW